VTPNQHLEEATSSQQERTCGLVVELSGSLISSSAITGLKPGVNERYRCADPGSSDRWRRLR
jgi:hypothetical protein